MSTVPPASPATPRAGPANEFDRHASVASDLIHRRLNIEDMATRNPLHLQPYEGKKLESEAVKDAETSDDNVANPPSDTDSDDDILSIADHRWKNADALLRKFAGKFTVDETGLAVHATSGRFFGISNFTSHKFAHPATYRTDGGLLPARRSNLILILENLPGVDARWADFPGKEDLLVNRFLAETTIEADITGGLAVLTTLLQMGISSPVRSLRCLSLLGFG